MPGLGKLSSTRGVADAGGRTTVPASTKVEGEGGAIGHKGIGFKSVLEVTSRPAVYSALQSRG